MQAQALRKAAMFCHSSGPHVRLPVAVQLEPESLARAFQTQMPVHHGPIAAGQHWDLEAEIAEG